MSRTDEGSDAGVDWLTTDCHKCDAKRREGLSFSDPFAFPRMIVCTECGNKRCPKATDHDLACTRSNEPGQDGSVYA